MDDNYDLKLLKGVSLPIDDLIRKVYCKNSTKIRTAESNTLWKDFNDVTPRLVDEFKEEGEKHVKELRKDPETLGYLFLVAKYAGHWYTAPHFDYINFPLMRNRVKVLSQVRKIAEKLSHIYTAEYDAICLSLLYFYALLVNPNLNWITMDYLANGNRYHQYGTRLKGKMKTFIKKKYM